MKTRLAAAAAVLLSIGTPATAHRLDEYLQAALISVERNRVGIEVHLTPGVAVLPLVLAMIDTNADGVLSDSEQRAYAGRVVRDLSLTVDGDRLWPRLISTKFPGIEEMQAGLGEIQLELAADLPGNGPRRGLVFENHHQSRIAAYLVNCLVPSDPGIRLVSQDRNESQSHYQLDYEQAGVRSHLPLVTWLSAIALLLFARFALLWRRPRLRFGAHNL